MAQNLRQLARCELGRSTSAVAELGEALALGGIHAPIVSDAPTIASDPDRQRYYCWAMGETVKERNVSRWGALLVLVVTALAAIGCSDSVEPGGPWTLVATLGEAMGDVSVGPNGVIAGGVATRDTSESGVALSEDGETWRMLDVSAFGGSANLGSIREVFSGSGGYVVVAEGGTWESEDGTEWTGPIANPAGLSLGAMVEGEPGTYLATGWAESGTAEIWRRDSGGAWTQQWAAPVSQDQTINLSAIAEGSGTFVAVGSTTPGTELKQRRPTILTSSDGQAWAEVELQGDFVGRGGVLTSVAWSQADESWLAGGWDGVSDQEQRALVFTSPDGISWSAASDLSFDVPDVSDKLSSAAATSEGFIAAGSDEYARDPFGILWALDSEGSWTRLKVDTGPNIWLREIASLEGDRCIAAGQSGSESPYEGGIWVGSCTDLTS